MAKNTVTIYLDNETVEMIIDEKKLTRQDKVIDGEYNGSYIVDTGKDLVIAISLSKKVEISNDTVEKIGTVTKYDKTNLTDAFLKATTYELLLGENKGILGYLTADEDEYTIMFIKWKNGKNSLITVKEKTYKKIEEIFN